MKGNVFKEDVDNGAMIGRRGNSDNLGSAELKGRVNYVVNSKERETVIFREELKVMGTGSKSWNQVTKVNVRLIMGRMMNRALGVRECHGHGSFQDDFL
jgi:hypothetical protein